MQALIIIGVFIVAFFLGYKFALIRYCVKELMEALKISSGLLSGELSSEEALRRIEKLNVNIDQKPLSNGDKIKLTWLPYNNGFPEKNVYIGSEGIVEDLSDDGSFVLNMGTSLLIVGRKYKYVHIK